ncbi:hypothetical protein PIB30_040987 [Stylosanthes scabra]|uniref:Transposase MuDR plant domain-containing protein n=1 Tax=Stylosanthes scabra TaxID=79078 RepID=A0ABU6VHN9_9FABA|nr:hypothetical protein [Stylosanthes scabra]
MDLQQLKDFILRCIGQEHRKRVQKVYYRYPHVVDGTFHFKRFRLRYDIDVALIRGWHLHLAAIPLLELYAVLIDEGNDSEADSQSGGGVARNIRWSMLDLNRMPEDSSEGSIPFTDQLVADVVDSHDESVIGDPTTHPYLLNHDSDNDKVDNEPEDVPQEEEDGDEEAEEEVQGVNYFGQTQPAYAQPELRQPYDHPTHFRMLNLGAMDIGSHGFQGGPDDDPVDEFQVGQEFANKEAVMLAVKTYSIRRAVEYKILESDRLKYAVQCAQFGPVCRWSIRISYHRRHENGKLGDTMVHIRVYKPQ